MAEKPIAVPDGMVDAVMAYQLCIGVDKDGRSVNLTAPAAREVLRRGLLWLSDNPIEPTKEQWNEMWQMCCSGKFPNGNYKMLCEWQRRMFIPPEPELSPVAKAILQTLIGSTLSPADADAIFESLAGCSHGWEIPRRS